MLLQVQGTYIDRDLDIYLDMNGSRRGSYYPNDRDTTRTMALEMEGILDYRMAL